MQQLRKDFSKMIKGSHLSQTDRKHHYQLAMCSVEQPNPKLTEEWGSTLSRDHRERDA